jgi:fumarate hydratase subunit beta
LEHILTSPFECSFAGIKPGDRVLLNGYMLTGRDAAHKRLHEMIQKGEPLPVDIRNQAIYYTGPCPPGPGRIIGPCGPTTSGRMDRYTPLLLDMGLKIMIGKGSRSAEVIESMKKNRCIYLAAVGGAGAVLSRYVKESTAAAFPDLGPEAIYRLYVEGFPTIAVIDIYGNDLYSEGVIKYRK